jgi:hypothetical protein
MAPATCSTELVLEPWPRWELGEVAGNGRAPGGHVPPLSPPHCATGRWEFLRHETILRCVPLPAGALRSPVA